MRTRCFCRRRQQRLNTTLSIWPPSPKHAHRELYVHHISNYHILIHRLTLRSCIYRISLAHPNETPNPVEANTANVVVPLHPPTSTLPTAKKNAVVAKRKRRNAARGLTARIKIKIVAVRTGGVFLTMRKTRGSVDGGKRGGRGPGLGREPPLHEKKRRRNKTQKWTRKKIGSKNLRLLGLSYPTCLLHPPHLCLHLRTSLPTLSQALRRKRMMTMTTKSALNPSRPPLPNPKSSTKERTEGPSSVAKVPPWLLSSRTAPTSVSLVVVKSVLARTRSRRMSRWGTL